MLECRRAAALSSSLASEPGLVFLVVSSLWSVIVAVPDVPIIRETSGDKVGPSIIVEAASRSLPSSIGSSVSVVVVVVML